MAQEDVKDKNPMDDLEPQAAPAPSGREYFMQRMKEENADYAPADDDQFINDIRSRYDKDSEELAGYRGVNEKLKTLIDRDPRFGALISMMNEGKSSEYAIGRIYGRDFLFADEDSLEELEQGYQEQLKELAESKKAREAALKNIEDYKANLQAFASENGLDEEATNALSEAIYTDADNFLNGIIPKEYIEYKFKGLSYDKDVKEAADAGLAEGRNQKIDAKKAKPENLPDVSKGGTYGGKKSKAAPEERKSFYDGF